MSGLERAWGAVHIYAPVSLRGGGGQRGFSPHYLLIENRGELLCSRRAAPYINSDPFIPVCAHGKDLCEEKSLLPHT